MKMYKCKVKGTVDSDGCFTCFARKEHDPESMSRVLCKQRNITDEMVVESVFKEEVPTESEAVTV
ncbi:MAG: hypothetical protein A2268_17100 [Candidatus Raymondbacteria bacterium RifOxyA12_full_50_37]|uniref:Uncharacterized protein n=1 Tax=Candidatus Raymondbacteria bacterium RIFOXYD12_FULL_49_13 TaxID=1817890 RepID=A0A1F7FAB4_UNCRA|nr:MAG: hypothetical protein A2268_17100 [Candidatus Raymondbacteria bacterium RifOxyA12_full_50_37]OGJ86323.1 MAG: hypothetical protein A2248_16700 [Candidatus Raymondbacteria bacterium RIFOXYA2_FULL_49_16]OGJ95861.1 MAG: hypothetical protein A2453_12010 [Candidatus Raymondbacteria bacterium RIFOXYC2_FULL_50_21]OGK03551.1 MAG: hypothetical protein A2519_14435 [Candidatus Raymondbacteria bacterium RIFOXYD12_FULL_49_13]OGP42776.1 MAG: hypothetical protein A2324_01110 [Candidatus Raymondbacteria 